tara:strand:- start:82 stop:609 length:528 start_codon:yes stop_codon:yes gene_type:complete
VSDKTTNKERDFKIVSGVMGGKTYASIGRDIELSGGRVAQVYMKHMRKIAYMFGDRPRYGDKPTKIELSNEQVKAYFDAMPSQRFTVKDKELYNLGGRVRKIFERNKINTKNDVLDGIKSGRITPYFAEGYGHQSHEKVCDFVGIDYERKIDKKLELQHVKYLEARGYKITSPHN